MVKKDLEISKDSNKEAVEKAENAETKENVSTAEENDDIEENKVFVLRRRSVEAFCNDLNKMSSEGWQRLGSLIVTNANGIEEFNILLIKSSEEEPQAFEHKIIASNTDYNFTEKLQMAINEGWIPMLDMIINTFRSAKAYYMLMIKSI